MTNFVRALCIASAFAVASPAYGQENSGNGFLFHTPTVTFTLTGGYAMPTAASDIFTQFRQDLTLNQRSFDAFNLAGELAFRLTARTDVVVSIAYAEADKPSEFRHWTDNLDLPIQQHTSLARWPVTVGAKYYLTGRGRSLGDFAWVPARYSVFVGAGAGLMGYNFRQEGDFIDAKSLHVFHDSFNTEGWTPTGYASGGMDYALSPKWALTTELKYHIASGDPGTSFVGFHRIDLSGLNASVGFTVRY